MSGSGTQPTALLVDRLTKVYPDRTHALDALELRLPAGSFFGLLGPNGAGKATPIGSVAGLVRAPAGRIFVFGHDAVSDARARLLLGVTPQEVHVERFLTARELLVYHGRLSAKGGPKPHRLSGGIRRRLLIARALVHRPRLAMLDEPTAGVDLELRRELWRYLRLLHGGEGLTVLFDPLHRGGGGALRTGRVHPRRPHHRRGRTGRARRAARRRAPGGRLPGRDAFMTTIAVRLAQRRGMVALAGREVRRVLSLWTQTILPAVLPPLPSRLRRRACRAHRRDRGRPLPRVHASGAARDDRRHAGVREQPTSLLQAKSEGYIEDVLTSPLRHWQLALAYMTGGLVRGLAAALALALLAAPFAGGLERPAITIVSLALAALICGADSYPGLVSLARFRERLPLVAFLLLLVVCLLLLGVACACFSDHPMQALERALAAIPALPALVEVWSFVALVALGSAVLLIETRARARAPSPALLQRFLL